jgi:hypothetical protein
MSDLMESRAKQRGWVDDDWLSPGREGFARMEEYLFWVAVLNR